MLRQRNRHEKYQTFVKEKHRHRIAKKHSEQMHRQTSQQTGSLLKHDHWFAKIQECRPIEKVPVGNLHG